MSELPEPWATAAEQAGVRQTFRGVAEAAGGLSHVTVQRLIDGRPARTGTIKAVAKALNVSEVKVREWAGVPTSEWGPWNPPASSHLLNPRTREALEALILSITEGGQHGAGTTPAEKSGGEGGAVVFMTDATDDDAATVAITATVAPEVARAARHGKSSGKQMDADLEQVGEYNQDEGN